MRMKRKKNKQRGEVKPSPFGAKDCSAATQARRKKEHIDKKKRRRSANKRSKMAGLRAKEALDEKAKGTGSEQKLNAQKHP